MLGPLLFLGLVAVLAVIAFRSGLIERHFIYFPDRDLTANPSDFGLAFEEVLLTTGDGVKLHGWFVPGEESITWLWFHGNAGNIGRRLENLKLLHDELGVNVFLFDYRGYGRSQGTPSEKGTYRDAEAALAYLRSREDVDPERIVFFGRSLGAGVAVELATRYPPYVLILESPFLSIQDMAKRAYPILSVLPLLRTSYDSVGKIGKLEVPILVIHGDRDDIIPFEAGRTLFEKANEPKNFYAITGAGHNDTYVVGGSQYFSVLRHFIEDPRR